MSRAARELNLTDGAVSRAVRELEAALGFSLFARGNRAVLPTPAARALADDVRMSLDHLAGALGRARRTFGEAGPLVLSCEPTFLIRWLIPRLAGLQAAIGVSRELRLVSAGGAVPFARDGIDLAVRRADFPIGEDVATEVFLEERIGPVCRPDLAPTLSGAGAVDGVLLHTATRPGAWAAWSRLTGTPLRPSRELRFEHFYLSLQAALSGAGLAIGPIALVADDVASGALTAPRGFVADGTRYVLMARKAEADSEAFRLVGGWLKAEAARMPTACGTRA